MKSLQLINKWLNFKHLFFPQSCLLCAAGNGGAFALCSSCLASLSWHASANCCPQCALASVNGEVCGHCLQSPPAFDATRALFRYAFPLDSMLQRYKYAHQLALAHTFGGLMAEAVAASSLPDILIPMPLHAQRLRERGFNQAAEIGRVVAKRLALKLDAKSCMRARLTPPQVSLPLKQRVKNMRNAFRCENRLDGLRVALLDDVMTTGASLNALAKTVKDAGAIHVECWVVARTLPH